MIDIILHHYLICALWSSSDDDGLNPFFARDIDDIAEETKAQAREDILDFLGLLEREGVAWEEFWSPEQFGHDFWLTRNGHGAGFWDRASINEIEKHELGEALTKWAETMGSVDLYIGADGKVYA